MIAENELTIIEKVRAWKEENAAEHDFDIDRIIASAREREAESQGQVLPAPPQKGKQASGDGAKS
ncbi:MAG: hypothetical protein ACI8T1_005102 [Verrucomicrobiales bacterium]|jgi:hypothetical protein